MYKINSAVDKPDIKGMYKSVYEMMKRGIKITNNIRQIYSYLINDKDAYLKDIQSKYGIINPNSPAQIINYIDSLNDSNISDICCDNGVWTSKKEALTEVAALGYEFASDIISFRTASKYASTVNDVIKYMDSNGFIHPVVTLTKTNRISYSNPALMNIPKQLLWSIVTPMSESGILISADIKNQEPGILLNMNKIDDLKKALNSPDGLYETLFKSIPVYTKLNLIVSDKLPVGIVDNNELRKLDNIPPVMYTPKKLAKSYIKYNNEVVDLINTVNFVCRPNEKPELPKEVEIVTVDNNVYTVPCNYILDINKNKKVLNSSGTIEVTGEINCFDIECEGVVRTEFKRAWIAMTYGASIFGIRNMCHVIDGDSVYKFFTSNDELNKYRANCNKMANAGCQTINTYFGTELNAGVSIKSALRRTLLDLPIQGTAADILSLLVKHFNEMVEKAGLTDDLKIYYTRHDELIIEVSKGFVDKHGMEVTIASIRDLVEHQVDDWIPFKVDVEQVVGADLSKIYSIDTEVE